MKRPLLRPRVAVGMLVAALMCASPAFAGPMVCPTNATTNMGQAWPLANTYNQTGLTANYTCGVTDFNAFVPLTGHASNPGSDWIANVVIGSVTWDMGAVYSLLNMGVWNFGSATGNPQWAANQIQLWASADGIVFVNRGFFGLVNPNGAAFAVAQMLPIFMNARFVQMDILSNFGGPASALGEVAFEGAPVPEPGATLGLLGTVLAALASVTRRWRR